MERYLGMRWRTRSRSRTRSPEPASSRTRSPEPVPPFSREMASWTRSPWRYLDPASSESRESSYVMRFATTAVADRIAWRQSVPVGMSPGRLQYLRSTAWSSWKRYPLSVAGAAAFQRRRASSSDELGAIGRSRSGTAFPSPYAHAARPPPVRPPRRGGRQFCDRCLRQRPGDRIRRVRCQRRVGPGCTPGCLLVELRGTARQRVGLCADWPHCRSPGVEVSRVQAVTEALFPLYPDDG